MFENLFNIEKKTFLVTGGSSGIGLVAVEILASRGANVIIVGRSEDKLKLAMTRLKENGITTVSYKICDISNKEDIAALESDIANIPINGFINSAGMVIRKKLLDISDEEFSQVIDVDFYGAFYIGKVIARNMVRHNTKGKMVFILSTGAFKAAIKYGAYSAAKAGVDMLAKTFALELAEYGITCNTLAPTATNTSLTKAMYDADPERLQAVIKNHPLGRIAEPEDYAGALLYLMSPASDFMTGEMIIVDGGKCAK